MVHARKVQNLPILGRNMREMLVASAASLDTVPATEQVAVAVSLFYFSWEDRSGLPAQIVMRAERQKLLDFQAGRANAAALDSSIRFRSTDGTQSKPPGDRSARGRGTPQPADRRDPDRTPADDPGGSGPRARTAEGARRQAREDSGGPRVRRACATCWPRSPISSVFRWSRSTARRPSRPKSRVSRRGSCASAGVFPIALTDSTVTIAMADPLDFETISAVRGFSGLRVRTGAGAPSRRSSMRSTSITARPEKQALDADAGRGRGRRGSRAPARHGERGAGHPPGERHDRAGGREARQRYPHRAVREGVPRPLSASMACCSTRNRRRAN